MDRVGWDRMERPGEGYESGRSGGDGEDGS